jgi:lipoate---protein ligase
LIALFEHRFSTPAEHLAADEALLDFCEASDRHPGFVRFWEARSHFVVLGYGKQLEREVYRDECTARNIPILRRCSGGGTVLQGPGCFNYTLILPIASAPELETITGANCFIMQRIRSIVALASLRDIEVCGHTDLVHAGRKFSGNAQRRKRRCLLFHGCFLIDFDLSLITRTLRLPEQQPVYRAAREHHDFIANLTLDRVTLQEQFVRAWGALEALDPVPVLWSTAGLVRSKYSTVDWNERH